MNKKSKKKFIKNFWRIFGVIVILAMLLLNLTALFF